MLSGVVVARQPDGGKMAPAQFPNNGIFAVFEFLADLDGVVAALAVVFGVFFVGSVIGGVIN